MSTTNGEHMLRSQLLTLENNINNELEKPQGYSADAERIKIVNIHLGLIVKHLIEVDKTIARMKRAPKKKK